jgi:hypothetical protein
MSVHDFRPAGRQKLPEPERQAEIGPRAEAGIEGQAEDLRPGLPPGEKPDLPLHPPLGGAQKVQNPGHRE